MSNQSLTDELGQPIKRRAKRWMVSDRILVALLLILSAVALAADVAVVYIYLTSNNKLPGLLDNPNHAYFWATVPIMAASVLAMLPYFKAINKKIKWRVTYGGAAALLFALCWVPGFVGLFSTGLQSITDLSRIAWQDVVTAGNGYDEILKWLFMGGQIFALVFASSSCWLSIFIMIEERRIERPFRNPAYDRLLIQKNELMRGLGLAQHKLGNHQGIKELIKKKSELHGERAVGHFRGYQRES
jgi:hypothetical protein